MGLSRLLGGRWWRGDEYNYFFIFNFFAKGDGFVELGVCLFVL